MKSLDAIVLTFLNDFDLILNTIWGQTTTICPQKSDEFD